MLQEKKKRKQPVNKVRKVTLINFDKDVKLWSCVFFAREKGNNVKKIGYIDAPENFEKGFRVRYRKPRGQTITIPSSKGPAKVPLLTYVPPKE